MDSDITSRIDVLGESQSQLALCGTLDIFLARELLDAAKRALAAEGDVHLDCSALERLDTSALQILLALQRQLAEQSRALALVRVNEQVSAFLGFGGAERLFAKPEAQPALAPEVSESQVDAEAATALESDDVLDDGWSAEAETSEAAQLESDDAQSSGESELPPRLDGEDE